MLILFPSEPFSPKKVDSMFEDERAAAKKAGFETALINIDKLDEGKYAQALPKTEYTGKVCLRTWMLDSNQYVLLDKACKEKELDLINSPVSYAYCHELPHNLSVIENKTPKTTVISDLELSFVAKDKLAEFINYKLAYEKGPFILKDYVKSEKYYWNEACYIPDLSDLDNLNSVVNKFLELRGDRYTGGLVFREFIKFEGYDESSNPPQINEHRIFILNKHPLYSSQYWGKLLHTEGPDFTEFEGIISEIPSNFYSMDVARTQSGEWMIVELGDGQVAGLPENTDPNSFYRALYCSQ